MSARTSKTDPLKIACVQAGPNYGRIGITFCPGKHDQFAVTGVWERDLLSDLHTIKSWGATMVMTLMEGHELVSLQVPNLGQEVVNHGMMWRHLPIADYSIPDDEFEAKWLTQGFEIRHLLRNGKDVLIHCKGGLGRAGTIAARLLVELGMDPKVAIRLVRTHRPGAIETPSQLSLVQNTRSIDEGLNG
jgi:predicted protein tyrosine phosphatase